MKQILRHACTLYLPVKPDSACTMVDMISPENHVDRRMHFDPSDLRARQILLVINMMDMIIFYNGEHTAQMPNDSCLVRSRGYYSGERYANRRFLFDQPSACA